MSVDEMTAAFVAYNAQLELALQQLAVWADDAMRKITTAFEPFTSKRMRNVVRVTYDDSAPPEIVAQWPGTVVYGMRDRVLEQRKVAKDSERTFLVEHLKLPKKKATRRDRFPTPGSCNVVSSRGGFCVLPAGHEKKSPMHRNGRGSKFLEVVDYTGDVKLRRRRRANARTPKTKRKAKPMKKTMPHPPPLTFARTAAVLEPIATAAPGPRHLGRGVCQECRETWPLIEVGKRALCRSCAGGVT